MMGGSRRSAEAAMPARMQQVAAERSMMSMTWVGMASSSTKCPAIIAIIVATAFVHAIMTIDRPSLSPRPCSSTPTILKQRPSRVHTTRNDFGAKVAARTMNEEAANMQPAVPPKKNSPAPSSA